MARAVWGDDVDILVRSRGYSHRCNIAVYVPDAESLKRALGAKAL